MKNKVYKLAHRGYSDIYPENTKLAFDKAVEYGFDGVELDLHLTKDKKVVIIHDFNTKRVAGVDKIIEQSNLNELKTLNYADNLKFLGTLETILTLDEFLELYKDKMELINLEIKTENNNYQGIEEIIYKTLIRHKVNLNKILLSSFNLNTLHNFYKLNHDLELGFLIDKKKTLIDIDKDHLKIIKYLNVSLSSYKINKKFYDSFAKYYVFWTVKSKKSFNKYLKDINTYCVISNKCFWDKKYKK
ncbi:glycerophosphodiester phosphodiesterase [Mycoplasma crocodyli]|uniref:Glycerophosphodiester phosphodiesterase n=1 Tax=Mycoplasma crocodyli (strain ATCC 51981 / MP145) TaxID=512564 RepID=D5E4V3_MYCCM|nr:glycerophosphodiester phosphodiesterase family protein [Mycoplasma crocodyli]ADE19501.1 glycerophosphodiester phosphodiesterase [Mycoplasma crocodyli MP145]